MTQSHDKFEWLGGRVLHWVSWDPRRVATVAVQNSLACFSKTDQRQSTSESQPITSHQERAPDVDSLEPRPRAGDRSGPDGGLPPLGTSPASETIPIRLHLVDAASRVSAKAVEVQAGLTLWAPTSHDEIPEVCRGLCEMRDANPDSFRCCYLSSGSFEHLPMLLEAGAQIVVDELPSLVVALRRITRLIPWTSQGVHPLTDGIMQQLPWSAGERAG